MEGIWRAWWAIHIVVANTDNCTDNCVMRLTSRRPSKFLLHLQCPLPLRFCNPWQPKVCYCNRYLLECTMMSIPLLRALLFV